MFGFLNSIIQAIVDKTVQNVLQTYIVNFSLSQCGERSERDQLKKSEFSKLNVIDNVVVDS